MKMVTEKTRKKECLFCQIEKDQDGENLMTDMQKLYRDEYIVLDRNREGKYYIEACLGTSDISNRWTARATRYIKFCPMCGRKLQG